MKPKELKAFVEKSLSGSKAVDVITIDLKGKTDIADYMVVASGTSSRHVISIAETLISGLRDEGYKGFELEGKETGEWVLVDLFDVIVHLFQPEIREKYEIEEMWQFPGEKKVKEKKAKEQAEKKPRKTAVKKPASKKPAAKKAPAKKRVVKKTAK